MKRVRTAGELLVPEGTICPGIVMVIRYIYYLQLLNKVTVIKTKVLFPQGLVTLAVLATYFMSFGLLVPQIHLTFLELQSFAFDHILYLMTFIPKSIRPH